ncbi:hypothetical protein HED60_10100 [Planctomycetales bacterium ZRK34]|nr:hypothetical protein HED60_10100 [Planctomycetales bacterium ZRK34]
MQHDARTRQAIDALAELLLTGPQPDQLNEPVHIDAQPPTKPHAEPTPVGEASDTGPKLRIADDPAPPAIAEAVLLGHLPGFASPWVSQYAADLAQRHQGAALLRLGETSVEIELFDVNPDLDRELDRQPESNPLAAAVDEPSGVDELVETLHDLGAAAGAYVLLLDHPNDPAQRQRLLSVDHWTVLTSANDAAVVGCYQMLKSLLAGSDHHPSISLMFMGCDEPEATSAAERINRAAGEFLNAPIQMCGARRRMRPAPRQQVGHFAATTPEKLWAAVTQTIDLTPPAPQAPLPPAPAAESTPEEPIFTLDPKIEDTEVAAPPTKPDAERSEASGSTPSYTTFGSEPDLPPLVREAAPPPPPPAPEEPDPEPEPDDSDSESQNPDDSLAQHLPDLTTLKARSPRHPQVELAVDSAGRLHLLLKTHGSSDTETALATLNAARSWLTEHRELIAMTIPDRAIDLDTPPQAHLLTEHPAAAAEFLFAAPPDQRPFRLHLLTPVTVAGQTAWACASVG